MRIFSIFLKNRWALLAIILPLLGGVPLVLLHIADKNARISRIDAETAKINENPSSAAPYLRRAGTYGFAGMYKEAIEDCDRVIRLDARSALAYSIRGKAYYAIGDFDKALRDLNTAVQIDASDPTTFEARARVHFAKKDYASCQNDLEEAKHVWNSSPARPQQVVPMPLPR